MNLDRHTAALKAMGRIEGFKIDLHRLISELGRAPQWLPGRGLEKQCVEAVRMIEGIAESRELRIPPHKLLNNIAEIGNTTSASIPIVLAEAARNGRLQRGDRVLLVGFGTGYSLGITLLTWQ